MKSFDRADARPRIYIERRGEVVWWRLGPSAMPHPHSTPGEALDRALEHLGSEAARGAVVIIESGPV